MEHATIAHSLVAAHDDRVQELARLYAELARVATAHGAKSEQTRASHRVLGEQLASWERADQEAERRDVVTLPADQRAALVADIARALEHAERYAQGLRGGGEQHVVRSLKALRATFPTTLTRAALARTLRSTARLARIEALNGPMFLLGSEAEVLVGAIESATAPIPAFTIEPDPDDGFRGTLGWGLRTCLVLEPGAAGAADLGLGVSPAVAAVIGAAGDDYPYVPRGRFGDATNERAAELVRPDLESTGPIGWASASDAASVARDLRAMGVEHRAFVAELTTTADRVDAAAARGRALIGWIEHLSREDEGRRKWLVDPETDGG